MPTIGIPVILSEPETVGIFWNVSDTCVVEVITALSVTPISASDTVVISATDVARVPVVAIVVSDVCACLVSDTSPSLAVARTIADSILLGWIEPSGQSHSFFTGEYEPTQITEGAPLIAGNFVFTATDAIAVQASDASPTFPLEQAVLTSESLTTDLTEGGQLISVVALASETLGIATNDSASLLLKFLLVTDSLDIPASEAATIFSDFITKVAVDSDAVQAVESIAALQTLLTQLSTAESLTMPADDASLTIAGTATVSDAILTDLQAFVDAVISFTTTDSAAYRIDSEDANIINAGGIFVTVFASDDVVLQTTDLSPSQLRGQLASDGCALPTSDAASVFLDVPLQEVWDGGDDIDYTRCEPDPVSYRIMAKALW